MSAVAAGASGGNAAGGARVDTAAATPIILRGRRPARGPWRNYLWLELDKTDVVSFTVCAVWRQPPPQQACRAAPGNRLPRGTLMRLEQRPIAAALRRADSPGWGMVGASPDAVLEAVLSNTLSGNRIGTFSYRVTLRNASGRVLARSNTFRAFWHR
jgi:hypothetical protein